LKAGKSGILNSHYETDMTGMTTLLHSHFCSVYFFAGIIAVAGAIKDMEALSKLIFSGGVLGEYGWEEGAAIALEAGMTEANFSNKRLGVPGAIIISAWLSSREDTGALTKFDISRNDLRARGGMALAAGLKGNQVITELNIGSNKLGLNPNDHADTSGAVAIADVINDMWALTSLDISYNNIPSDLYQQIMQKVGCDKLWPVLADTTLTELDVSGIDFGSEEAVAVAKYISGNGALTSLDISSNNLVGEKGTGRYYEKNMNWCHQIDESDEEEEIMEPDFSDIIAISNAISDMGAISTFTFDSIYDGKPVTMETSMVEADFGGKGLGASGAIMAAAFLPKCT
jgi:hypothetical protein